MSIITGFKNFWETTKPAYTTVDKALDRVRVGTSKVLVEKIRSEPNPKKKKELKDTLPCICFSGKFLERNDNAITQHSGFVILDFDKLTDAPAKKRDLQTHPFIYAVWISPGGEGVKALVRIPAIVGQHRGHYAALVVKFPELDTTSCNESRICYESYDPDIYVYPDACEFTDYVVPGPVPKPPVNPHGTVKTDYGKLNLCAAMIRNAPDGAKHETLLKAARLAGGYIGAGIVDEDAAIRILEAEIEAKPGVENIDRAKRTIRDGIGYGKTVPLYEQNPEPQPTPKEQAKNGVVFLANVWESMDHSFQHGKARGETTHFSDLDEHFTFKRRDLTGISGMPGSGKSEFIVQLMLIKSVIDGYRWAVFSPESYPADEFYDSLIHALTGKTPDPAYGKYGTPGGFQMPALLYEEAANFIQNHFFYIYPETEHTIEEIEANFSYCIKELGVDGVMIDPFNQLVNDFSMRDDQYLQKFITTRKRFAVDNNVNYFIVIHPKQMQKNKEGEYDPVNGYDLANGAMWLNKLDNFISVYRPNQILTPKDTSVEIHVKKIKKQKLVGIPGTVFWSFDRRYNRYYNAVGFNPLTEKTNPNGTGKRNTGEVKISS